MHQYPWTWFFQAQSLQNYGFLRRLTVWATTFAAFSVICEYSAYRQYRLFQSMLSAARRTIRRDWHLIYNLFEILIISSLVSRHCSHPIRRSRDFDPQSRQAIAQNATYSSSSTFSVMFMPSFPMILNFPKMIGIFFKTFLFYSWRLLMTLISFRPLQNATRIGYRRFYSRGHSFTIILAMLRCGILMIISVNLCR